MAAALLVVAAAVGLTSRGGVFFRQQRVGRDGQVVSMLTFRSMVDGAEGLDARDDGNGVLSRPRTDPRVTRVGAVLRRCSSDELPQLVDVAPG